MRVLIIKVCGDPEWREVEKDSKAMQEIVGGELEFIPTLIRDVVIVGDEEAKLKHKPFNFITEAEYIAGEVFVAGMKGEELVDITNDQAQAFMAVYFPGFHQKPIYKVLFPDKE